MVTSCTGRDGRRRVHGKTRTQSADERTRSTMATSELQPLEPESGLPSFLVEAVQSHYGEAVARRIREGWGATRRVTLRANTLRGTRAAVAAELDEATIGWQAVPWYTDAFILARDVREYAIQNLDVYREGRLYVQGLSSMLPPLAVAPRAGADVLDMCAAPGGKTSEMAALSHAAAGTGWAHITACERSFPRSERLKYNLTKLGAKNVHVMRCDARSLDENFSFDQILLDAPCSGSGSVHVGDSHAARFLTPKLLKHVEHVQRALLERGLHALKPGGELVYSTCSILAQENEQALEWALERHCDCTLVDVGMPLGTGPLDVPLLPCQLPGAVLVCPSELYEGFFIAKIKKHA